MSPRKIALLGGGIASLSAAYALTNQPGHRERFELSVYQLGHRLGGKGASGCNVDAHDRIEEHGLHVWMGCYHHAFRLMRDCYAQLDRPPGAPLASWTDAFEPHPFVTWEEQYNDRYRHWFGPLPPRAGQPGDADQLPSPWEFVKLLVPRLIAGWYYMKDEPTLAGYLRGAALESVVLGLYAAHRAAGASASAGAALLGPLTMLRERVRARLRAAIVDHDEARRVFVGFDLMATLLRGLLIDRVTTRGFDAIDDEDLRAWLSRHGADELTLRCGLVTSLYDFVFAYIDGDRRRPAIGAGTILRVGMRMLFAYRGSVFYRMRAGMGEAVFVPLYELLRARGVRFEFFHRVDRLRLSADRQRVAAVELTRQATLSDGVYQPLIERHGLRCWPSTPRYEQLREGQQLRREGIDLESHWTPWPGVGDVTLRDGDDFDAIVLGIPVGALSPMCDEIAAEYPRFARMRSELGTVRTQAMQLWLTRERAELGWTKPPPLLTGYAYPHSTWADFTHLLAREGWPSAGPLHPRSLAYLCGPMAEHSPTPPRIALEFPAQAQRQAQQQAVAWLEHHAAHLWPAATTTTGTFDWSVLVDPNDRSGAQRLDAQYVRANVNPWDRYVQSLPGSWRHRLRADESGLDNLVLAGDWLRTGLNLGCIESAVMSGLQAARALSGERGHLYGELDFPDPAPAPAPEARAR